jgi:hypothetical protein
MTVYATREFERFARKAGLAKAKLLQAASDVMGGRYDADLGGGVFKMRIARDGSGKSGGFRTIIFFRAGGHCFLAHGFAKNEKSNVSAKELKALKRLAEVLLGFTGAQLRAAKTAGELIKVSDDDEKQEE